MNKTRQKNRLSETKLEVNSRERLELGLNRRLLALQLAQHYSGFLASTFWVLGGCSAEQRSAQFSVAWGCGCYI